MTLKRDMMIALSNRLKTKMAEWGDGNTSWTISNIISRDNDNEFDVTLELSHVENLYTDVQLTPDIGEQMDKVVARGGNVLNKLIAEDYVISIKGEAYVGEQVTITLTRSIGNKLALTNVTGDLFSGSNVGNYIVHTESISVGRDSQREFQTYYFIIRDYVNKAYNKRLQSTHPFKEIEIELEDHFINPQDTKTLSEVTDMLGTALDGVKHLSQQFKNSRAMEVTKRPTDDGDKVPIKKLGVEFNHTFNESIYGVNAVVQNRLMRLRSPDLKVAVGLTVMGINSGLRELILVLDAGIDQYVTGLNTANAEYIQETHDQMIDYLNSYLLLITKQLIQLNDAVELVKSK